MVSIGGINKTKADRKHCGICWKEFEDNEPKVQRSGERFYRCMKCDNLKE